MEYGVWDARNSRLEIQRMVRPTIPKEYGIANQYL
jgi:hypothetical protein